MNTAVLVALVAGLTGALPTWLTIRSQRQVNHFKAELTEAQRKIAEGEAERADFDLVAASLELHQKTATERLDWLQERLRDEQASKVELLATVDSLRNAVDQMANTLDDFLDAVNGHIPPEWRVRLEQLVA